MQTQTVSNIKRPKQLIDPVNTINRIEAAAEKNEHIYLRVFNIRTNKNHFCLHKGRSYLFRDPYYIETLNKNQAISLLFRLNDKIRNSRFLSYEIKPESEQ